jgi:hypothetical protein
MKSFRTFDMPPSTHPNAVFMPDRSFGLLFTGIKILGFKDVDTLPFDANIKHSVFLHPNEAVRTIQLFNWLMCNLDFQLVTGSIRTFKALLDSMISKRKYALTRCLFRKNHAMVFCAMLPQVRPVYDVTRPSVTNDGTVRWK